jgi:hypothetical protein
LVDLVLANPEGHHLLIMILKLGQKLWDRPLFPQHVEEER